jgi:IS30 family transposase
MTVCPLDNPFDAGRSENERGPLRSLRKGLAARIGKSFQSVYREIARNRKPDGRCQPWFAHNPAHVRRRRPKPHTFDTDAELRQVVADKLGSVRSVTPTI